MGIDKSLLKGKNPEQKKIIKYFKETGLIAYFRRMKDDVYEQMVLDKINSLNLKQKALGRFGLEEDQLKEIPPVNLYGYHFGDNAYSRVGKDGFARSSKYDIAWLFFSSTHIYMYSYVLDMTSDSKKELAEEYAYKNIVSFSTFSESIESIRERGCLGGIAKVTTEYNNFRMSITSGDKLTVSTTGVPNADNSVNAMKQKLREKNN